MRREQPGANFCSTWLPGLAFKNRITSGPEREQEERRGGFGFAFTTSPAKNQFYAPNVPQRCAASRPSDNSQLTAKISPETRTRGTETFRPGKKGVFVSMQIDLERSIASLAPM